MHLCRRCVHYVELRHRHYSSVKSILRLDVRCDRAHHQGVERGPGLGGRGVGREREPEGVSEGERRGTGRRNEGVIVREGRARDEWSLGGSEVGGGEGRSEGDHIDCM